MCLTLESGQLLGHQVDPTGSILWSTQMINIYYHYTFLFEFMFKRCASYYYTQPWMAHILTSYYVQPWRGAHSNKLLNSTSNQFNTIFNLGGGTFQQSTIFKLKSVYVLINYCIQPWRVCVLISLHVWCWARNSEPKIKPSCQWTQLDQIHDKKCLNTYIGNDIDQCQIGSDNQSKEEVKYCWLYTEI